MQSPERTPHPSKYRWSILTAALVAITIWWGVGLPYSLFGWLPDETQLRWILICYAWEVPVAGGLGPLLFPQVWLRRIERQWNRVFGGPGPVPPAEAAALERAILDYPARVAVVVLVASIVGYAVGALQLRLFAQLPVTEIIKVLGLGVATGLIGALFAFLYLERLLTPLAEHVGRLGDGAAAAARRVPLYVKVFACSLILILNALLLLGTIVYSRGERILEEGLGERVLVAVRGLASELGSGGARKLDPESWARREAAMRLGPSGYATIVTPGAPGPLDAAGFRPAILEALAGERPGFRVDRVYRPRIVAFAPLGTTGRRVVAIVERADFDQELDRMVWRGGVVIGFVLVLALLQGLLFARQLTRPVETLTRMATDVARAPTGPWPRVPVRTNDEVGALATAFNGMVARLEEARRAIERYNADLERRVIEATGRITALYDVTATTTASLEIDDVLRRLGERALAALDVRRLLVVWQAPELEAVEAYRATAGQPGEALELEAPLALDRLAPGSRRPAVLSAEEVHERVPATVLGLLGAPRVLCLPLVFKERLLGAILADLEADLDEPDLEFGAALAGQAATALANAGLYETVRRAEAELRRLSHMRAQLQEENLRTVSRELHDGFGQVLTVINMDLGVLERSASLDPETLRARLHDAREQVSAVLHDVRTMSQVLRPSMLDFGVVPTLAWAAEKFSERTGIPVSARLPPEETRLPPPIELVLYRVAQEVLTNVAKHARARHVELSLEVSAGEVRLRIADDGVGFDATRSRRDRTATGVGLIGMRERVAHHGGRLEVRTTPRAGVEIVATIPLGGLGRDDDLADGAPGPERRERVG